MQSDILTNKGISNSLKSLLFFFFLAIFFIQSDIEHLFTDPI